MIMMSSWGYISGGRKRLAWQCFLATIFRLVAGPSGHAISLASLVHFIAGFNTGRKGLRDAHLFHMAAVFALASAASAEAPNRPTAILVSPIHEAQIVRADDGKDHVEYELLVVNVFPEPVTLSSVTVLDPAGKELMRIEGDTLTAATQTVFARTQTAVIPASAAVSVDVDLILPPDTAPERVTHRIAYTLKADSELALMVGLTHQKSPSTASRPW